MKKASREDAVFDFHPPIRAPRHPRPYHRSSRGSEWVTWVGITPISLHTDCTLLQPSMSLRKEALLSLRRSEVPLFQSHRAGSRAHSLSRFFPFLIVVVVVLSPSHRRPPPRIQPSSDHRFVRFVHFPSRARTRARSLARPTSHIEVGSAAIERR